MQVEYLKLHIEDLTGISLDVITVGLAALVLILIIIMIVNGVKMKKLKKSTKRLWQEKMPHPWKTLW